MGDSCAGCGLGSEHTGGMRHEGLCYLREQDIAGQAASEIKQCVAAFRYQQK